MEACSFYKAKKSDTTAHILAKVQHLRSVRASELQKENCSPSAVPNKSPQQTRRKSLGSQPRLFKSLTGGPHHRVRNPLKKASMLDSRPPTRQCSKLAAQPIKEESQASLQLPVQFDDDLQIKAEKPDLPNDDLQIKEESLDLPNDDLQIQAKMLDLPQTSVLSMDHSVVKKVSMLDRPPTRQCSKLAALAIKEESEDRKPSYFDNDSFISESSASDYSSNSTFTESECSVASPRRSRSPPETVPVAPISEYERQRQQNMAERLQFLASLDIGDSKDSLRELLPRAQAGTGGIKPAAKRTRSPRSPVCVRKSQRLQQRPADAPVPRYDSSFTSIGSIYSPEPPAKSRPQPGLSLDEYLPEWQSKDSWQQTFERLQKLTTASTNSGDWTGSFESVSNRLRGLRLSEDGVAKVVPQRITTMALHPCTDRDLLLCGDKAGTLGVWEPGYKSSTKGACPFEVHAAGITKLTVDAGNSNRVLTSSYDGSTRATDIHANHMTEVFSVADGYGHPTWHAQQDHSTLLVSTADGDVAQVDLRAPDTDTTVHDLDSRHSIKVVTVHPTSSNYIATANKTGMVCLWDCRSLRANKPVSSINHPRTITGLTFSPVTGSTLLATCHDNTIRLLSVNNFSAITNKKSIKHDNHTGRWLTTLKADFVPGREDLFIVGSMNRDRVVELWNTSGSLCHRFSGELLQTFSTTVCCHSSRLVVAAGNSSGRCHLFR